MSNRLRFTIVYEFDYLDVVDEKAIQELIDSFLHNPTDFINPTGLEEDEKLYIDVEDITEGEK